MGKVRGRGKEKEDGRRNRGGAFLGCKSEDLDIRKPFLQEVADAEM